MWLTDLPDGVSIRWDGDTDYKVIHPTAGCIAEFKNIRVKPPKLPVARNVARRWWTKNGERLLQTVASQP